MLAEQALCDRFPKARAFEKKGGPDAALLVHGFTGTPAELRDLGELIAKQLGWAVHLPLLPGHGTDLMDLAEVRAEDWVNCVAKAKETLAEKHSHVHLIGLSMGAVLCLDIARRSPRNIASLTLLAPALWLKQLHRRLLLWLLQFLWTPYRFDRIPKTEPLLPDHVAYDAYSLKGLRAFSKLTHSARKIMPLERIPALIMYSKADQIVHPYSATFLAQQLTHPSSACLSFPQADHVLTLSSEKHMVNRHILEFIKKASDI